MNVLAGIRESLTEILDIEPEEITPETYIVRDLNAESIDLLELSVALNARFRVEINDDQVFLRTLRLCLNQAAQNGGGAAGRISREFPFLGQERIGEILADLDGGPVLRVKDIAAYVSWQIGKN
ncbi:MAG: acyl carrier protein [Syntrophobacteraceae bacterium]